jgi:hypothetical protein
MTITKQTTRIEFTDTSANFNVTGSCEKLQDGTLCNANCSYTEKTSKAYAGNASCSNQNGTTYSENYSCPEKNLAEIKEHFSTLLTSLKTA